MQYEIDALLVKTVEGRAAQTEIARLRVEVATIRRLYELEVTQTATLIARNDALVALTAKVA